MLDPNLYTPEKLRIILTNTSSNLVVELLLVVILYLIWKHRRHWLSSAVIATITLELFIFGRGNLLMAPLPSLEHTNTIPDAGLGRVISTSDVQEYVGPHVYWNHLRVRQPFAPDLSDSELKSYTRLSREVNQLPSNLNMFDRLYTVSGYSAVVLENYARYWLSTEINSVAIPGVSDSRLSSLGVEYIITGYPEDYVARLDNFELIAESPVRVYRNQSVLPRAFIRRAGTSSISSYQPHRVVIETENMQADHLVLTDAYYPGWRVFVDGSETEVAVFDQAFRQVTLSPGAHQVEFRYQPDSVRIGAYLSGVSFVVTVVLLGWQQIRRLVNSKAW